MNPKKEVLDFLLAGYQEGREKSLARTKFEEGFLWLSQAEKIEGGPIDENKTA